MLGAWPLGRCCCCIWPIGHCCLRGCSYTCAAAHVQPMVRFRESGSWWTRWEAPHTRSASFDARDLCGSCALTRIPTLTDCSAQLSRQPDSCGPHTERPAELMVAATAAHLHPDRQPGPRLVAGLTWGPGSHPAAPACMKACEHIRSCKYRPAVMRAAAQMQPRGMVLRMAGCPVAFSCTRSSDCQGSESHWCTRGTWDGRAKRARSLPTSRRVSHT